MTRLFLLFSLLLTCSFGYTQSPPVVYSTENTCAGCPAPALPTADKLPRIEPLPDPFVFFDGTGRNTSFDSWRRRRNEIKASIEKYEIGPKPDRSDLTITAAYSSGVLTVHILRKSNGVSLTLNSKVSLPSGTAPAGGWPAVIGMALAPSAGPVSNSIAKIDFMHDEVTTYAAGAEVSHVADPYFLMYPEYYTVYCPGNGLPCQDPLATAKIEVGQYSAWAWGVSRLIDGMEIAAKQLVNPLPIDIKHLGVEGCSYAGKMALYSGAFDERIAATFAHESGGGGAPAWRVSHAIEPEGTVEKTNNTNGIWFKRSMKTDFGRDNVYKFPHDHHELQAMIAPRALFVSGNTDFTWLSNKANYVTAKATQKIYETLGVGDRYGYWIDGNHGHCAFGVGQQAAVTAFYNKFLAGQNSTWDVHVSPASFANIDYERWTKWWGTGIPSFPPEPPGVKKWFEAECATVGADWEILTDAEASNGKYVTVKSGLSSTGSAPAGAGATVVVPFTIDSAGTYTMLARVNCPTADDDSYWVKIDDGAYVTVNGLTTTGWQWATLTSAALSAGQHTLTIAYREDGAKLDKLLVTTSGAAISGLGGTAFNCGNLKPVVTPGQQFTINDRIENNSTVGTVTGSDEVSNANLQDWQISGGTGASAFAINPSDGAITVRDRSLIDFENQQQYTVAVTVSDGTDRSDAAVVTINLARSPVITPSQSFHIDRWVTDGMVVGRAIATDKDPNTSFQHWTIAGGSGASLFAIDATTGEVKAVNSTVLNSGNSINYSLRLTVSDGENTSREESVAITLSEKVPVCHSGATLYIGRAGVPDHVRHGDNTNPCTVAQATSAAAQAGAMPAVAVRGVQVYPNPVRDVINIDLGTNEQHITTIQVVDMAGKVYKQVQVTQGGRIAIAREGLKPGMYLLRMQGDTLTNYKIVVQ